MKFSEEINLASQFYKNYTLTILTAVYTLSFMDRAILGVLMQPIKEELLPHTFDEPTW